MKLLESDVCRYLQEYNPSLSLGEPIGRGGTSVVYDLPGTRPPQVLKVMDTRCLPGSIGNSQLAIQTRKKMWNYFHNEIQTMRELQTCRCVMPVTGAYEYIDPAERGMPEELRSYCSVFLVQMHKLETLPRFLESSGLNEQELIQLAMDLCEALHACEERHILHRDIKPDNIFVVEQRGKLHFVLGDFGFCRRMEEPEFAACITKCGTPPFMAPEIDQKQGFPGYSPDLFSLGSTLYFLLSGGKFPRSFYDKKIYELEPLGGISHEFAEVIQKAVQFQASRRYQHASEMMADLRRVVPISSRQIVGQQFHLSAKQAMLNGKFQEAIAFAQQGMKRGEAECRRLLAYCLLHEYGEQTPEAKRALLLLDEGVYEEDPNAQYIRATLYAKEQAWEDFFFHVQEAAEAGCVMAAYSYGRALYEGWKGRGKDPEKGRKYLRIAAEANYFPALRYYRRLLHRDPLTETSPDLLCLLKNMNLEDEQRRKMDIVKFL